MMTKLDSRINDATQSFIKSVQQYLRTHNQWMQIILKSRNLDVETNSGIIEITNNKDCYLYKL